MLRKLSVIYVAFVLPVQLAVIAVLSWRMGNRGTAILSIAMIPFLFVCWGLSHLLAGRQRREIARHMTDDERNQLNRMSAYFGLKVGVFFAVPLATVSVTTYNAFDQSPIAFVIPFVIGLIVVVPIAYHQSKPIREFFFETEYAKRLSDESASRA